MFLFINMTMRIWIILIAALVISFAVGYLTGLYESFPWLQLIVFDVPLDNEEKISILTMLLAIIGGFGALFQYWRNSNIERNHFVKISVSISEEPPNHLKVRTTLHNPVNTYKEIKTAFLIITRKSDDLLKTCQVNMKQSKLNKTNQLVALAGREEVFTSHFAFIPLPYYYSENVRVGNEELSYSYIFTPEVQRQLCPGFYEIRFFVFSQQGHYHRSVQDAFIIEGSARRECNEFEKNENMNTTTRPLKKSR